MRAGMLALALLGALAAAAKGKAPVKVVAVGDIACGAEEKDFNHGEGEAESCHQVATAQLTQQLKPDSILLLGDIQYPGGALNDYLQSFDKSWGALKPRIHPAPGNHEYNHGDRKDAVGYFQYFGAAAGTPDQGWYSFELGGWHVISLNSNCQAVGCGADSAQLKWLQADLAAHPRGCTLAFWHHPRFSTSAHGDDPSVEPFWQALSDAKVDLVLNGHDHDYQRYTPLDAKGAAVAEGEGIREFVAGTGGKSLYAQSQQHPRATRLANFVGFGVLTLELTPRGYRWKYVPEQKGAFADSGSALCRVRSPNSGQH